MEESEGVGRRVRELGGEGESWRRVRELEKRERVGRRVRELGGE